MLCESILQVTAKGWACAGDLWLEYRQACYPQYIRYIQYQFSTFPSSPPTITHEGQVAWAGAEWGWFALREGSKSPGSSSTAASPPSGIRLKDIWKKIVEDLTLTRVMPLGRRLGGEESSIWSSSIGIGTPATTTALRITSARILQNNHQDQKSFIQHTWSDLWSFDCQSPVGIVFAPCVVYLKLRSSVDASNTDKGANHCLRLPDLTIRRFLTEATSIWTNWVCDNFKFLFHKDIEESKSPVHPMMAAAQVIWRVSQPGRLPGSQSCLPDCLSTGFGEVPNQNCEKLRKSKWAF